MTTIKLKSSIIAVCMLLVTQAYAQYQISGRIVQEKGDVAIGFANVKLTTKDSVFVKGIACNEDGQFQLKDIKSGDYIITSSYLGYSPKVVALNGLIKSIDLGDIHMIEEARVLETVTVTASSTTVKADRLITFVTDQQKAMSSNGLNLLTVMSLPRLTVDPLTYKISLPGDEKVLLCINGVKVNASEIRALQPREIIRIEYLDNPGVRYENAGAVINYVLKREVTGGSVSLDLGNSITTGFGDDQIAAKVNYKKSEFGVRYSMRYRKPTKIWGDQEQTFNFEDGTGFQRFNKGLPGDMTENMHNMSFNYNLLDDKYYFNATLSHSITDEKKMNFSRQYTSLAPDNVTNVHRGANTLQNLPSLDLYYSRSLKNNQTVILNVVGTYINSNLDQKYEEKYNEQILTDIISNVDGKKYSIIGEGIYEKKFQNNNRFTSGLKHMQAFANNDYSGKVVSQTKMNQSETYIYAEYAGKKDKFSYIGGAGLLRSSEKQEGYKEYSFYTFRPKITLQYNFSAQTMLRLRSEISNSTPSLSNISSVDQYIDTLQIRRGNPALESNLNYITNLAFSWKKGILGIDLNTTYHYSPKAVMGDIIREGNKFIQTYNNQKNWQKFNSELSANVKPFKGLLMISTTAGINRYISNGNVYSHTHTNFYYRAQLVVMYKKFMGMFQAYSNYDNLWGESLNEGEDFHQIMVMYNHGKFSVGGGIMLPFIDKYERYSDNRNIYSPSKTYAYANDFSRMLLLKFSWNFNYGRKAKSGSKRINNADRDTGIVSAN